MVADRHHRDDLAAVEEQGQRPFHDDGGVDRPPSWSMPMTLACEPRIVRLGTDGQFFHKVMMGSAILCFSYYVRWVR